MEEILKKLQQYQLDAVQNGISYDMKITMDHMTVSCVTVEMHYSTMDSETLDNRNFHTCISTEDKYANVKLVRIEKFISNIEQQK